MTRVAWIRYEGDDIEAVVSMFVCRENPTAYRIRPSSGDGGVDVCVPTGDGHVEIYQVKRFAENLTSSQKQQVVESHSRIQEYAAERGWTIDKWYLTLPLDPTPENDEWLEKFAATAYFPCEWAGLARIEAWAAVHGDIVDYYLEGGKARLVEELGRFAAISAIPVAGTRPQTVEGFAHLEPAGIEHQLAVLRDSLNSRDPHFLYAFSVSEQPEIASPRPPGYPALVTSTARSIGESWVSFHVLARCSESIRERPITVKAKIVVEHGSAAEQEFNEMRTYGRVPTVPFDVVDLSVDLPGGLAQQAKNGKLMAQPADEAETFVRRYTILSPDGEELAEVPFIVSAPDSNHNGTGLANRGVDPSGFLELEVLSVHRDGKFDMTMRLHSSDPSGIFPDEIEQPLAFLYHFNAPNKMRVAYPRGTKYQVLDIPQRPLEADRPRWIGLLLRYVRALITVQAHVETELRIPDVDTDNFDDMRSVLDAARMLNGEDVPATWSTTAFTLHPGADAPEGPLQAVVQQSFDLTISGETIHLGAMLVIPTGPAQVANVRSDAVGNTIADLVPTDEHPTALLRWIPAAPDAPRLPIDREAPFGASTANCGEDNPSWTSDLSSETECP